MFVNACKKRLGLKGVIQPKKRNIDNADGGDDASEITKVNFDLHDGR